MKRIGIATAVVAAMVVVPAQAAYAEDGCGDDYFKGSDGYLEKHVNWQGVGSHNASIWHSGRVRFCDQDDLINNDDNRRAVIGYPSDDYPFESLIFKNGNYTQFCVKQTIQAHMTGIKNQDSWNISGTVSKTSPSVSISYSSSTDTMTVTVDRNQTCGANAEQLNARTSGIVVTASDESGEVEWVDLTTKITMTYWVNGTKYVAGHTLGEHDYS